MGDRRQAGKGDRRSEMVDRREMQAVPSPLRRMGWRGRRAGDIPYHRLPIIRAAERATPKPKPTLRTRLLAIADGYPTARAEIAALLDEAGIE